MLIKSNYNEEVIEPIEEGITPIIGTITYSPTWSSEYSTWTYSHVANFENNSYFNYLEPIIITTGYPLTSF